MISEALGDINEDIHILGLKLESGVGHKMHQLYLLGILKKNFQHAFLNTADVRELKGICWKISSSIAHEAHFSYTCPYTIVEV